VLNLPAPGAMPPVSGLDLQALEDVFKTYFETRQSPRFFFAPGWLDLMGCPTLGLGGWSLSLPVNRGIVIAAAPRTDRQIHLQALNMGELEVYHLEQPFTSPDNPLLALLDQVVQHLQIKGLILTGCNLLISSNLPPSLLPNHLKALEEALMLALYGLSGAEVKCGSNLGLPGQAWLKHQETGEIQPVPFNLQGISLILCDSRVQPDYMGHLVSQRIQECTYGLDLLKLVQPTIQTLGDLTEAYLHSEQCCIEDPIIRKRLQHYAEENSRVLQTVNALQTNNLRLLDELFQQSILSWKQDFELSCPEWGTLTLISQHLKGVLTERLLPTGDFAGCTLHWVTSQETTAFEHTITETYEAAFGQTPYISRILTGPLAQELRFSSPALI